MFNFNKGEEKREKEKRENLKMQNAGVYFGFLSNILLAVTPIIVFEIVQMITVLKCEIQDVPVKNSQTDRNASVFNGNEISAV